jgi:AcrR family transcriptional regulator
VTKFGIYDLIYCESSGANVKLMASRVRRGKYEGTKQAAHILRAARTLFIRDGAKTFSARGVAKEAHLNLRSVQHVFPTTDALLVAMLENVFNTYEDEFAGMLGGLPLSPAARWDAVVDWLIADAANPDTRRFFFAFGSQVCNNRVADNLLKEAYAYHTAHIGSLIAAVRPELDEAASWVTAIQVAALIEGFLVFSFPTARADVREAMARALKTGINTLVREAKIDAEMVLGHDWALSQRSRERDTGRE